MKGGTGLLFCAVAAALGGCVEHARVAVPSDLAATTERLEIKGMGAGTRGTFGLAGAQGRFYRSSESASAFGDVRKRGGGSFTVGPPAVAEELSGFCDFSEREIRPGRGIAVTTDRLIYGCAFEREGRRIEAELVVEAADGRGTAMFRHEREGYLLFEGQRIELKSIHSFDDGKLPTITPLGYSFHSNGAQIGAIDLNGLDKTLFAPRQGPEREAVIAAALALAIFWDPADAD